MSEEYLEIVDENDRVIGKALRRVVHEQGSRHRATHIFIFNSRGQLFLQKRSRLKDMHPGQWDSSAAGHVDPEESYDDCIIRELREELGARLDEAPERVLYHPACEDTGQEFVWLYRATMDTDFNLDPQEIETGGWFAPKDVDRWLECSPEDFASSFVLLWRLYSKETQRTRAI